MQRLQIRLPELSVGAGWIAALALTAWLGAGWFWRFTAPEPVALLTQPLTDPQAAARAVAQRHLFGDGAAAAGATASATARSYSLVGAWTGGPHRPGFAVISEAGKPAVSVFEGEDIAPGIKLSKVMADKATIVRDGHSETLNLVTAAPSAAVPPAPAASAAPNVVAPRPPEAAVPPHPLPQRPNLPSPPNNP